MRPRFPFSAGAPRRAFTVAVILALTLSADAGDILRGGSVTPGVNRRTATAASSGREGAAKLQSNAKDRLSRTTRALESVKAMQKAAREAAGTGRLGNPNGRGKLPRVPDGLAPNGLEVNPLVPKNLNKPKAGENPGLWIGARLPRETGKNGGPKKVTIVQTEQQAVLNWKTFNVGKKTELYFDQTAGGSDSGKWVAFNKVNDPKGRPSQILGSIKAEGQVYVINQNGIIFGGSSQVNVHTLVASALPINDNLIARGLLDNPDAQFLLSAMALPAGVKGTPAFVPATSLLPKEKVGDVVVETGAELSAPTTPQRVGGRIMLVGANVKNSGTISTPDGQTILAAGLQVGVAAHSQDDPSLRGLDVFVGAVADPASSLPAYAGTAINDGVIDAPRANVTIAGKSVQQNGFVESSTSVSLNGRIDLNATYDAVTNRAFDATSVTPSVRALFVPKTSGVVTLGEGSVTRILPELDSVEEAVGTEVAIRSQINARGLAVHFGKDSQVLAPNAKVDVLAGRWDFIPGTDQAAPISTFVHTGGQIYIDQGALLDVAGSTDVFTPQSKNILTLELRGSELADSPLQRDGAFRGTTITIDARLSGTFNGKEWVGTPLGDATGFLDIIERGVGQLTTAGGSVNLQAGDSVVLQRGATVDVSGGWLRNEGGLVKTTRVMQGSRLLDIADATPDQIYDGIYDPKFVTRSSKWGITKTYRNPLSLDRGHFESEYIQGAAGGNISITAPSMALDGKLAGNTVVGPKQLRKNASSSSLPDAARLSLAFKSQDPAPSSGRPFSWISLHAPTVVFGEDKLPAAFAFALAADGTPLALQGDANAGLVNPFLLRTKRRDTVILSPTLLTEGGFGDLTVDNGAGDISVPAGVKLSAPVGGELVFSGRNIEVQGSVTAPNGRLSFTANNLSPYRVSQYKDNDAGIALAPLYAQPGGGRFILGSAGVLSTAGLTLDERSVESDADLLPIVTDGGVIDVTAYRARLEAGSLVDVSGGVFVDAKTHVSYGDAGAIAIRAGIASTYVPFANYSTGDTASYTVLPRPPQGVEKFDWLPAGRLNLRGELRGYSGAAGGALALQAPFIQVGGIADPRAPGTVVLQPEFFNRGGFGSFDLTGIGGAVLTVAGGRDQLPGLVIAANTNLAPLAQNLFARPQDGADAGLTVTRVVKPRGLRTPVSLAFHSLGLGNEVGLIDSGRTPTRLVRGDLVMGDGASIQTDPLASVNFSGATVSILGSVSAPAGAISVRGGTNSLAAFDQQSGSEIPLPTVYLGSESRLSTAGTTVFTPDDFGRRVGSVLPGGTIGVSGNIVAARGSVLDVSGASGMFDLAPTQVDAATDISVPVNSGINAPLAALRTLPTRVDSDAGAITLHGGDMLFTDATLVGRAGGPAALGGTLDVSSGRFTKFGVDLLPSQPNLVVTQSDRTIPLRPRPSLFQPGEQTAVGRPVVNSEENPRAALGYFAADDFQNGGFDSLTLGGVVRFRGAVGIEARGSLKVADGGVLYADSRVRLAASYVALGQVFQSPLLPGEVDIPFGSASVPINFAATHGPGVLTVEADLIDIGNLSLRNTRRANFLARNGDIRGSGTLNISGHLRFEAGQIYTPTALNFTAVAYDYKGADDQPGAPLLPGSVTILASGARQLPLSAGGTLSVYASNIRQDGVLRAPMGTINLGWDGTGTKPVDLITSGRKNFPITKKLVLGSRSITSVSAVDPATGAGVLIPYGVSIDGNTWIDPRGVDITLGGLSTKNVNLSATSIATKAQSQIDLRGGGDLYAYRWVEGLGGSRDILASETSFAVLPGYEASYAPVAAFNDDGDNTKLPSQNFSRDPADPTTRDPGYLNNQLAIGDRVQLGASEGLAAGTYTLLPARYSLLPGAFLVTPKSGATLGTLAMPDGTNIVSGYRFNDLNSARTAPSVYSRFEVASEDTVRARASYDDFLGNYFLRDKARLAGAAPQLLPIDSGHLVFQATEAMRLNGVVRGQAPVDGRGAFIDVSTPKDIIIAGANARLTKKETKDSIVLKSSRLSAWGAESLLVGGIRTQTEDGTVVRVETGNLTVDNAGSPLTSPEIILVADKRLTVTKRSQIAQAGATTVPAELLLLEGDGALLRVSGDATARSVRTGVTDSKIPKMTIGDGAVISGTSVSLDSTYATDLSAKAILRGRAVNLSSGQISLRLDNDLDLQPTDGLVLAGRALRSLRGAESLSFLSYTSIDVYGSGSVGTPRLENLEFHAGQIRGFNNGGVAGFRADHILLDNTSRGIARDTSGASAGKLQFDSQTIELGNRRLQIDQFADVELNASGGILLGGKGRLLVDANLDVSTPAFFAAGGATSIIEATGDLLIQDSGTSASPDLSSGLGASLSLQGSRVTANSDILLPSGLLTLHATTGDVNVNGRLDVGGTEQTFNDVIRYTSGGEIKLLADLGDVALGKGGALSVAANKNGGDAGSLSVAATGSSGSVTLAGELSGQGGAKGRSGTFSLDVGRLPELENLSAKLNDAAFDESRNFRVRNGDVLINGTATSREFRLSADSGSIFVRGKIDASGQTGGSIWLTAGENVVLGPESLLTVAAKDFSNAGKGGSVTLEAGSQRNGVASSTAVLDVQAGSVIDLSVASANAGSAILGDFTGTLHLRAPQNAAGTDLQVAAINGTIKDASSIVVEGYKIFDLTATSGNLSGATLQTLKDNVMANGNLFAGTAGTTTAAYTAMHDRLLARNAALDSVLSIRPGAEIIHRTGNITLGTTTSTNANDDWNFSSFRFGPKSAPGLLTMRAAGNLVFNNGLHDGFAIRTPTLVQPTLTTIEVYQAALMDANPLLPMNAQSWSYRLTAGADFSATDSRRVRPLATLGADLGSLKLGRNIARTVYGNGGGGATILTSTIIGGTTASPQNRYQVLRTGSGDIDISAGRDVQLLNPLATIYTAGTKIDPNLGLDGAFDLPVTYPADQVAGSTGPLGGVQQTTGYAVQYTLGGGDVDIRAQRDIIHLTRVTNTSPFVADSQRQLPINWLYRRGFVDPSTGQFGTTPLRRSQTVLGAFDGGDVTSTSWWIDFSNFFQGIGALGGGDVSLVAGNDVSNVDAVIPTNARLPKAATSAAQLVELGGGDLRVQAGRDIDAGVYYVERGHGILTAGNDIKTNATRSPSIGYFATLTANNTPGSQSWLPTTLFLGKGGFDVSARGDVLLGPTANVFMLPGGLNNSVWYKTFFSTYAPSSEVNVSSLGGSVTLRTHTYLPSTGKTPMLQAWLQTQLLLVTSTANRTASNYQPWLRLNEENVDAFPTAASLLPPTLRATSFTGDLNLAGDFTLFPSAKGTVEFAAGGAVNGLQPIAELVLSSVRSVLWDTSLINISDTAPSGISGVLNPYAYRAFAGAAADSATIARRTLPGFLSSFDRLFDETASLNSVLQKKQILHTPGLLHGVDPEPVRLYALTGDISGLTLFSPKATRIVAGQDITDNAFYIQNLAADDISIVAAGRNLVAYNASSPLRTLSQAPGNLPPGGNKSVPDAPLAGDIQVSGPGAVAVLAGGNLDLGIGAGNADGTGSGLTTIGNTRNPYLPFEGADIIAAAGIGPASGLSGNTLDFEGFIDEFLTDDKGLGYLAELDPKLTPAAFAKLPEEQRNRLALEAFYLVLRDAGRDFANAGTAAYQPGFEAIETLFPVSATENGAAFAGNIDTRARDIRTKNGGNISLFAPHGELTLATTAIGNPLAPPGVVTETGGNISVFTDLDVDIGIGRIFTLRGGNMVIWSSTGDIAAGSAAKTVKSAPPTRVLIDSQSGDVQTDLAGLATGGGIGVLATVVGVEPGDVDLIAPNGVVDAGDAGIRVSGNLNIAATAVLNAGNISVAGSTTGVPSAPVVAAPNIGGLTSASNTGGAANQAAEDVANQARQQPQAEETPSVITVEVLGYGGGEDRASL